MNSLQKEVLNNNRNFLQKNVIWTNELEDRLVNSGILTESVQKEIRALNSREQKTGKLLEVVALRGSFVKFCDILLITGHFFLADFLRDEEAKAEKIDFSDLFKKLPYLEKMVKERDRKQLEAYVSEKVREKLLKNIWNKDTHEREKALEAQQKQLEQEFEFDDKIKEKTDEIAKLESALKSVRVECEELKIQVRNLNRDFQEQEANNKSKLNIQAKYSAANENVIQRVTDKMNILEQILKDLKIKLYSVYEANKNVSHKEELVLMENPFAFLVRDFENFLKEHKQLETIQKQYEQLLEERNYILAHLGFQESDDKPSLLTAYKEFAVRNDESMMALKQQVQIYNEKLEGQKEALESLNKENNDTKKFTAASSVWQSAILSVMRKQLHDTKHENRMQDTKIKHFENEMAKLRARINELEKELKEMKWETIVKKETKVHFPIDVIPSGHVSSTSFNGLQNEDESDHVKSEQTLKAVQKKGPLLPPLANKPLYAYSESGISVNQTQKRSKLRALGSVPRNTIEFSSSPFLPQPAGFTTIPVKLEDRTGVSGGGKMGYNSMSQGLDGLKTMHGKHTKPIPSVPVVKSTNSLS
ncbi:hypothetical protein CHS0354_023377 [Potamilus streckersoni]|uniref:CARD domain-containing protein n=1 Tax=Potamilus streckersoni TaxID=2493646 RepID=A0AAE0T5Q2_9BIVA|nr:hypothetical protein CHS0354_023377 [Potamilus streckersoni]